MLNEIGKSKKGIIIVRRHCVGKSGDESKQANKQTNKEDVHCKIKERKCFLHLEQQKMFCLKSLLRKSFKFYHSGGVQQPANNGLVGNTFPNKQRNPFAQKFASKSL